jgi:hypothetical protein
MIKRIFQDLDECILHTFVNDDPNQNHVEFVLGEDMHTYRTIIRPCAKELFEYYNSVVGKENVYILTSATREYAETLNRLGEFGLDTDHIFSREDIKKYSYKSSMWGESDTIAHPLAHKDNVLIDNLPLAYNMSKVNFMNIAFDNYHQTPEYYGVNYPDDPFFENIKEFIQERV